MPSVKWAIAIEKKNTATAKRRVFYFAYFPVSCPKTDAGFELSGARLPQNRRPLLGRKPIHDTSPGEQCWPPGYPHLSG